MPSNTRCRQGLAPLLTCAGRCFGRVLHVDTPVPEGLVPSRVHAPHHGEWSLTLRGGVLTHTTRAKGSEPAYRRMQQQPRDGIVRACFDTPLCLPLREQRHPPGPYGP